MSTTLEGTEGGNIVGISLSDGTYTFLDWTGTGIIPTDNYIVYTAGLVTRGIRSAKQESSGLPAGHYDISTERYFQEFDTSGISRTPVSATFDPWIVNDTNDTAAMICVETKFETDGALEKTDYDNHLTLGYTAKVYTEILPADSNHGRKNMSFTQDGLDAIGNLDKLQMVCLEYDFDYLRVEPTSLPTSRYTNFYPEIGAGDMGLGPTLTYTMGNEHKISSGKVNIDGGKVTIK